MNKALIVRCEEMKLVVFILVYFRLFCLIADVHSGSDGVEIESEFEDQESTTENLKRLKRNTDNFLKKYIDNLKNVPILKPNIFFIQIKLKKKNYQIL